MKQHVLKRVGLGLGILLTLGAASCQTIGLQDGPLPAAELQLALTDRSWLWQAEGTGAGIYFGPGGQGKLSLRGRVSDIRWYTESGRVCYRGNGGSCWLVYRSGGKYFSRSARGGSPYPWNPRSATRSGNRVF